jgi:hypothetical protein
VGLADWYVEHWGLRRETARRLAAAGVFPDNAREMKNIEFSRASLGQARAQEVIDKRKPRETARRED